MTRNEYDSIYDRVFDIKQDCDALADAGSFGEIAKLFSDLYDNIKDFLFDLEAAVPEDDQ